MGGRERTLGFAALALAILLAAPAADAGRSLQLRGAGGAPLHGPYKAWAQAAKVPLPEGRVRVGLNGCPGRPALVGCIKVKHPRVIYLRPDNRHKRSVFLHELGHVFDLTRMDQRDRRGFKRLHGRAGTRWWAGPYPAGEWFAEAYSLCARYARRLPAGASTTYAYRPSARRHRRTCSLIREMVADPRPRKRRRKPPKAPPTLTEPVQEPAPIAQPAPPPPERDCILPILCPLTS